MSVSKESTFLPGPTDIEDVPLAQPSESGDFQTDRVVTITAGHAVHDSYTGFLPPMLPLFIERFSLSRAQAGLLSVFMSAPSILQPVIGYVADRKSLKALVIIGPGLSAVMMSLLGIAPGYWAMAMLLWWWDSVPPVSTLRLRL